MKNGYVTIFLQTTQRLLTFTALVLVPALTALILAATAAFAGGPDRGGDTAGGGDPLELVAVPYSDTEGLKRAIAIIEKDILKSGYSDEFVDQVLLELNDLAKEKKIRMLPALLILGDNAGPEGYQKPKDANTFIALGGMTDLKSGATIFLAERLLKESSEKLAEVLLHEVIHHIVSHGLSDDEILLKI
jgi:Zn-dependent protease with chaperone function